MQILYPSLRPYIPIPKSFFFLFRTWKDFLQVLNLIMVLSPLIWWQSSILFESQTTSISPKMLQTVYCRFLSLRDDGIPTTSKHSFLLYYSLLWWPISREVTCSSNSSLAVSVTTRETQLEPTCSIDYRLTDLTYQ